MLSFRSILALAVLALLLAAGPASAGKLFTVDLNDNNVNELDGSDDVPFSFTGSSGAVTGTIRAVPIQDVVDKNDLYTQIIDFCAFDTGSPSLDACPAYDNPASAPPTGLGGSFSGFDVFIVDVVLAAGSAPIDEIGIHIGTDPTALDPDGAGFFADCTAVDLTKGCRDAPANPDADQVTNVGLTSSTPFPPFPGGAIFGFTPGTGTLTSGETSQRLFVVWSDVDADNPLSKDQKAAFMISSGTNHTVSGIAIVPEPATVALLGLGIAALAGLRRRQKL